MTSPTRSGFIGFPAHIADLRQNAGKSGQRGGGVKVSIFRVQVLIKVGSADNP